MRTVGIVILAVASGGGSSACSSRSKSELAPNEDQLISGGAANDTSDRRAR